MIGIGITTEPPKLKKHHRSIHNIRLQMIIDIQVFEFSNTCTVRASMVVVRLTSMEALILSVTVYIDPSPSQPLASGCVLECLPATACRPTAPVSGCRPSVIVPALAHRRPQAELHSIHSFRRGSRIQKGGFVQEFRLENRSYPDVHDFIAHASDYC